MKEVCLIRHFATPGNLEKRFNGTTDESIVEEIAKAHLIAGLEADALYVSPLKRTQETAGLLYPGQKQIVVEDFREIDFGYFEGKNHLELDGDLRYQSWIDSGGKQAFPGGEHPDAFRNRCAEAFLSVMKESREDKIAIVAHGGTIMSILDVYGRPQRGYYDWMCANGCGYTGIWTGETLEDLCEIHA